MTTQKNPVESLVDKMDAEIMDLFYQWIDINFGTVMIQDSTELREILEQNVSSHHDQLLAEMLEEVGEDIPNTVQNSTGNYVKIIPTQKDLITNEERSRIRSLLLAKKRKDL